MTPYSASEEWRRQLEANESRRRRHHEAIESVIAHISARHENPLQRLECLLRNRSRVEGDKRIVPESHGERQEGQHFGGDDQEEAGGNVSTRFSLFSGQHYRK